MKLADFLLSINYDTNVFNGHIQTFLNCIKEEDLKDLIEEIYHSEKNNKKVLFMSFCVQKDKKDKTNVSLSLYQKNFWKEEENQHFKDRLIICFDKIVFKSDFEYFKNNFIKYIEEKDYFEYSFDYFE